MPETLEVQERWPWKLTATITDPCAIHARAAALMCGYLRSLAEGTKIGLRKHEGGEIQDLGEARRLSPLGLMKLRLRYGDEVDWFAGGPDAYAAAERIGKVFGALPYDIDGDFASDSDWRWISEELNRELGARDSKQLCREAAEASLEAVRYGDVVMYRDDYNPFLEGLREGLREAGNS